MGGRRGIDGKNGALFKGRGDIVQGRGRGDVVQGGGGGDVVQGGGR